MLSVVTVQNCYSSLWTLLFSLVNSEGATDLLATYDLFPLSGQKTTALPYIQFEWPEGDNVTTRGKSVVFWRQEFCLLTYVAAPWTEECNCFHMWGFEFYPRELLCFEESLHDWLMLIAWSLWPVKISQLEMNSRLGGGDAVNSDHSWEWSDAPARYLSSGLGVLN
jgi:hypothetical protein